MTGLTNVLTPSPALTPKHPKSFIVFPVRAIAFTMRRSIGFMCWFAHDTRPRPKDLIFCARSGGQGTPLRGFSSIAFRLCGATHMT